MTTVNEIVQRVKAHPGIVGSDVTGLADADFAFAVSQIIPSALQELYEADGVDWTTRPYTLSDPAVVTVELDDGGTADLTDLVLSHGVMLHMLHMGTISHPEWEFGLSPVGDHYHGRLASNYDTMHARYWLEGSVIHTQGDSAPLEGVLAFNVPQVGGLDKLSPQRSAKLVDLVVARLRGVPVPKPEQKK